MLHKYPSFSRGAILALLVLLLSAASAYAQARFRTYSPTVCPNQTVTYVLENIPAGYRINAPGATGGGLLNQPSVDSNNNTASYQVQWGLGAVGSITPGLEQPIRNQAGDIVRWDPVPVSPGHSVVIKSVFGVRINAQINNTSSIDLPLCGGAQQLTLSIPQFFFDDARRYPLDAYVWQVPAPLTVVNGTPATDFGPGVWFTTSNSIIVSAPAGQLNAVVRVRLWSRECNQNPAYNNPPGQLVSFDQSVTIRRVPPVVTSVTASRTALTCGDQRPITLTATASQAGATFFSWVMPTGWAFAPGSSTNTATISVIPSGGNGGSPSVQASYTCVSPAYTTPNTSSSSVTINYSFEVAQPMLSGSQPAQLCNGANTELSASAIGATRYEWTPNNPAVQVTPLTANASQVRLTAPAQGAFDAYVDVRAFNDANNCQASLPTRYNFRVGDAAAPTDIFINGLYSATSGEPVPDLECGSPVNFRLANGVPADVTSFLWTTDGTILSGQGTISVQIQFQTGATYGSAVARAVNACGSGEGVVATVRFREDCQGGGGPGCLDCSARTAPAAYPNPADATLTLQQPAGTQLTVYNAQGRAVYRGRASAQPTPVDTRAWPEGLYYLHTRTGNTSQRHQIQIQH